MVTETSAAFDMMVGKKFPSINKKLLRPYHSSLGAMEIVGGGALTICEKDVGTERIFYDIKTAEYMGYVGQDPEIWGEAHFGFLIELLVAALCAEGARWDDWRYHPAMWSVEGVKKDSATKA